MSVKMWTKKETQATIRELRKAGYVIEKPNGIYKIMSRKYKGKPWMIDGKPLFSAMIGMGGYLVNYHERLMS
tara:strand:+ start:1020 stop:1235 length:216 start_codon:yes stop_codon:yes gene_type:complete